MSIEIGFWPPASGGIGIVSLFHSIEELLVGQKSRFSLSMQPGSASPPLRGYLLTLNPTVSDLRAVKRAAADLVLSGVHKSHLTGVLLQEGLEAELPAAWVSQELALPVFPVRLEREILFLSENQGKGILGLAPRSKMVQSLRELVKKFEDLFVERPISEKIPDESPEAQIAAFEEILSARVWQALTQESLSPLQSAPPVEIVVDQTIQSALLESPSLSWTPELVQALRRRLLHQLLGRGPLQDLLDDPEVSEVMVNGPQQIYVERGGRLEKSQKKFVNEAQLQVVIERLVAGQGRRVDTASPLCDARLPEGGRINVALPPLSLNGSLLTIRRFRPAFRNISEVIRERTLTPEQARRLESAVRERQNIIVAGNTASGKTTLLNLMSAFIADEERILTLEDAAELDLQKPHVVRLETRKKNLEGVGEVTMSDLVVNALRMRPDRLIVGECRGSEAIPMLQAMNTGHDGSMTTLHANSAEDAVHRLEALVLLGAPSWPLSVIRQQIATAIDLIVFLKRTGAERRCEEICELQFDGTVITLHPMRHPGESPPKADPSCGGPGPGDAAVILECLNRESSVVKDTDRHRRSPSRE